MTRKNKSNANRQPMQNRRAPVKEKLLLVEEKRAKPQNQKPQVRRTGGLLSTIGGLAGGFLGGPAGSIIGSKAGDLLARITGFGSYKVNRNSLINSGAVPQFKLNTDGVEVCHREFLRDLSGSTSFVAGTFPINPGYAGTFPWLSTLAANFEEYDMLGLVFEYRPSSGSAVSAASSALGVVVYATDYNALAPSFTSKRQMESYEFSTSCVPFESMLHPVECAKQSNALDTLYIRTGAVTTGDLRMYDMGNFQVATAGMQSAYVVGELWVSYHVRLKRPRINPIGPSSVYSHFVTSPVASGTAASPLGTGGGSIESSSNLIGIQIDSASTFEIQYPGVYKIDIHAITANNNIAATSSISRGSNITAGPDIYDEDGSSTFGAFNAAGAVSLFSAVVTVNTYGTGSSNTITMSGLTSGTAMDVDVYIHLLPSNAN